MTWWLPDTQARSGGIWGPVPSAPQRTGSRAAALPQESMPGIPLHPGESRPGPPPVLPCSKEHTHFVPQPPGCLSKFPFIHSVNHHTGRARPFARPFPAPHPLTEEKPQGFSPRGLRARTLPCPAPTASIQRQHAGFLTGVMRGKGGSAPGRCRHPS